MDLECNEDGICCGDFDGDAELSAGECADCSTTELTSDEFDIDECV